MTPGTRYPRTLGRFTLLAPLGDARSVHLAASDERIPVALKLLDASRAQLDVARIPRLEHAHLTRIVDGNRFLGEGYVAYELVAGRDLAALVLRLRERSRPLPVELALAIVRDAIEGLVAAHAGERPAVHGEIDPSQVLLSWHGEVKLVGCGLARPGKPGRYSPPETTNARYYPLTL